MGTFNALIAILVAGFMIWLLIRTVRHQPQAFSTKNLSKSLTTLGFLGLLLIALIGFTVILLRQ